MSQPTNKGIWKVIGASSVGTLIEWYDFIFSEVSLPLLRNSFFLIPTPLPLYLAPLPLLPLVLSFAPSAPLYLAGSAI